jgi:hypothetical protein
VELSDFLGDWRFERLILDGAGVETGRVSGTALLTGTALEAVFDEVGTLHLPGQSPMTATRRYLWRAMAGGIDVRFDDGRAFHTIILGGQSSKAAHWCDPDQYDVAYDFSGWPLWSSVWQVKGPRKDYTMRTHYRRT